MDKTDFFHDVYSEVDSSEQEETSYTYEEALDIMDQRMEEVSVKFDNKEYEEVLPTLLDIYDVYGDWSCMSTFDDILGSEEYIKRYAWLCYRISYCYAEQKDYVRAYFYIDQVRGYDSNCFMKWINMVINGRRIDAYGIVEDFVNDPSELQELFKEDQESLKKVMDFLERRLGYLQIEMGEYDKARELFTRMLDNPASCDFAREEQEYLNSTFGSDS